MEKFEILENYLERLNTYAILDPVDGSWSFCAQPDTSQTYEEFLRKKLKFVLHSRTDGSKIAEFLENDPRITVLTKKICDHYVTVFDGRNLVGRYQTADQAIIDLEILITNPGKYGYILPAIHETPIDAYDYFLLCGSNVIREEYAIDSNTSDEELELIGEKLENESLTHDTYIYNVGKYLRQIREDSTIAVDMIG